MAQMIHESTVVRREFLPVLLLCMLATGIAGDETICSGANHANLIGFDDLQSKISATILNQNFVEVACKCQCSVLGIDKRVSVLVSRLMESQTLSHNCSNMHRDCIELVFWAISAFAVLLNLIIVAVMLKEKRLRQNPPNCFIIALACVSISKVLLFVVVSAKFFKF
jgi:hypothetical protein